ncbi:MAG: hypothetical protein JWR87_83 [Segetibacter sp.]|nr:hypothetical protein [Segetibacter sp.]
MISDNSVYRKLHLLVKLVEFMAVGLQIAARSSKTYKGATQQ